MPSSCTEYSEDGTLASTPPIHPAVLLRDAWAGFIARWGPWEWFATFTFEEYVHPERADKLFRLLVSQGNRTLYGPRWHRRDQGITWVRGLEYQRRQVIHYHAILKGVRGLRRMDWVDWWYERAGIARIYPVRVQEAVLRYVSKYVVKGGEIDLGGPGLEPRNRRGYRVAWPCQGWFLLPLGKMEALQRLQETASAEDMLRLREWAEGRCPRREVASVLVRVRDLLDVKPMA